jgi:type IV secretion system protein TrbJ
MRKIVLTTVALLLVAALPATSPGTGIPVIDVSNLTQNIVTALHQVMAYTQQVSQYELQLQQYANQVKNTVAPVAQVWQAAQQTMNGVLGTVSMFQNGSQLQGYLNQFENVNYWLSAPPSAYTYQTAGSIAQKQANDAMVKGIVQQQAQIKADAATLERLQAQAGSADGQMKALMAANQLAALQQEQLLQIRELLLQEQQALAARNSTLANDEAMREAATKQFFSVPTITISDNGWKPSHENHRFHRRRSTMQLLTIARSCSANTKTDGPATAAKTGRGSDIA